MKFVIGIFIFVISTVTLAEDKKVDQWAGNLEMNGFALKTYENFAKDWELITVRYRQDSGEYRFVYANPLAAKAMKEGKTYPEGSVFAKTAYLLTSDPSFPSSLLPGKVNRYQLMVKDEKKFKDTGSWGYALFDSTGHTYAGEPKSVSQSCHACHQIVREKQYVFSEMFPKDIAFFSDKKLTTTLKKKNQYLPQFENLSVTKLPKLAASHLPKEAKTVRSIKGELRKHLFEGTLNEIRPFLATEALASNGPAILLSEDGGQFALVYPDSAVQGGCTSPSGKSSPMVVVMTTPPKSSAGVPYADRGNQDGEVALTSFCYLHQ